MRHRDPQKTGDAARYLARLLAQSLGTRVLGPAVPPVARVRSRYIQEILLKLEKSPTMARHARDSIRAAQDALAVHPHFKAVELAVNVDPM